MHLEYEVDGNDFIHAGEASASVKRTLKQLGIEGGIIRKVAIAMYEAEINMVIHASGGKVEVELEENQIRIVLSDHGPGIKDVSLAMKEGYSTASHKIRELGFGAGMGLPNMKRYSDEMQIETKLGVGTTVKLTFNLL